MVLGVEIGGTKLQVGVSDARGQIKQLVRVPVNRRHGRDGILRRLEQLIPPLLVAHTVRAIGVGYGGPVDFPRGRVVRSFHITGWAGFELRRWFERRFKLPTLVENDTNCAALAEALLGAGTGHRKVFYSNVGTGIGGGLVMDGAVYNGRCGAMEIGHTRLGVVGPLPSAGVVAPRGGTRPTRMYWRTVETLASGLSIEHGKTTLARSARYYGAALANAITLLNPDVVVIGGGVSLAGEKFLRPVREQVARLVFHPFRANFRIVPAALGETVVVVGAALLAGRTGGSPAGKRRTGNIRRERLTHGD
jgi:glucokinase